MVKVGRKFFFNQAHVKKNRLVTIVSVIVVIIVILVTFFSTSYFHDKSQEKAKQKIVLKDFVEVEVYNSMPNILSYFKSIENVQLKNIAITYDKSFTYEEDLSNCSTEEIEIINKIRNQEMIVENNVDYFNCLNFIPNKIGNYPVKFNINNQEYSTQLHIIDTQKPNLVVKDVTITEEESYYANDFVNECNDNSKQDCYIDYYNPDRGQRLDYSKFKNPGTYEIKIVAKDSSGNETDPQTATLTIKKINYYTVTFNSNGGSSIESQKVREGERAYSSYPTKNGHYFDGWLLGNKKFDFETPITSDITLNASWKKISTPSYSGGNSGGNSGSNSSGSSGSSQNKCTYGTYDDTYSSDISMSATLVNGRAKSDCADRSQGNNDATFLRLSSMANNIINKATAVGGELYEDARYYHGNSVNLLFTTSISGVLNSKGGFSGIYIKVIVQNSDNNKVLETYEAYDCTSNSCKFY